MRRMLVVLAVLCAAAPAALAQGHAGSIELTPTIGYWFGDTLARGTVNAFDFDVTVDDSSAVGVRISYRFTENWALEGGLMRFNADLVTGREELFGGAEKLGEIRGDVAEIGFEGSFGRSRLVPFLAGGIGAIRLDPDMANARSDNRFVGHFGVGFKLFLTPGVALRFDWRGHSANVRSGGDDCDWWERCSYDDRWLTFKELSLGLAFAF